MTNLSILVNAKPEIICPFKAGILHSGKEKELHLTGTLFKERGPHQTAAPNFKEREPRPTVAPSEERPP
jgi:hypothetical protein